MREDAAARKKCAVKLGEISRLYTVHLRGPCAGLVEELWGSPSAKPALDTPPNILRKTPQYMGADCLVPSFY
jgi:hypothetical protein